VLWYILITNVLLLLILAFFRFTLYVYFSVENIQKRTYLEYHATKVGKTKLHNIKAILCLGHFSLCTVFLCSILVGKMSTHDCMLLVFILSADSPAKVSTSIIVDEYNIREKQCSMVFTLY